jgi:hypothetical protein
LDSIAIREEEEIVILPQMEEAFQTEVKELDLPWKWDLLLLVEWDIITQDTRQACAGI